MKNTKWYLLIVVLLLGTMALVACGGGTETTEQPVATEAAEEVMAEPTEEVMAEPTEEMMAEPTEEVMAEPTEEMAEEMAGEDVYKRQVRSRPADALPRQLLPLHRAKCRDGHQLHPVRRRGLRHLQVLGLAGDSGLRHGSSGRAAQRWL